MEDTEKFCIECQARLLLLFFETRGENTVKIGACGVGPPGVQKIPAPGDLLRMAYLHMAFYILCIFYEGGKIKADIFWELFA